MRCFFIGVVSIWVAACGAESSNSSDSRGADTQIDGTLIADVMGARSEGSGDTTADVGSPQPDAPTVFDVSSVLDTGIFPDQSGSEGQDDGDSQEKIDTQVMVAGLNGKTPPYETPIEAISGVADHNGDPVGVENLKGNWMVLWFFPKASTFG